MNPAPSVSNLPLPPYSKSTLAKAVTQRFAVGVIVVALLATSSSVLAETDPVVVDISAGELGAAINAFAVETGVTIYFNASLTEGLTTQGLQGSYTVDEGLRQLLVGSGLDVSQESDGSYRLLGNDIDTLPPLKVSADVEGSTGSAAQGYVVSDSSGVGPWGARELQDTPYSISVTSKDLIENAIAGDMDQIYKMNPVVQNSAPTTVYATPYAVIRGIHTQSGVVDGIKLSSTSIGISMEELEQVEVVSGPTGFMFGAGKVGGTTNYVLKRPTYDPLTQVTVANYGDDQWVGHIDLGNKIDDEGRFAYRFNGVYQDGETGKQDQNVERKLVSGALDWNITDQLLMQVEAGYTFYRVDKIDSRFYAYADSNNSALDYWIAPQDNDHTYTPDWTFLETETDRAGINLTYTLNEMFTFRSAYLYKKDTHTQQGMYPVYYADSGWASGWNFNSAPYDNIANGYYAYLDSSFETAGVQHTLTVGLSGDVFEVEQFENNRISGSNSPIYNTALDIENYIANDLQLDDKGRRYTASKDTVTNVVVGDDVVFGEHWSALLGINYSTIESKSYNSSGVQQSSYDESELTPTLSLIYKPTTSLTAYASYIEGLEEGTTVANNPDEYNNPGEILAPYVSKQYELGSRYGISDRLMLTAAAFRLEKANSFNERTANGKLTVNQDGLQIHQGFELTLKGKVTDNLTLITGGTWMDLSVEKATDATIEGKKPTGIASKLAKVYAEYSVPAMLGLTATAGAYYTGEMYKDSANQQEMSDYTIFDAGLRYETNAFRTPTVFRLNVSNLTNKSYWATSYSLGIPRTIAFSASVNF